MGCVKTCNRKSAVEWKAASGLLLAASVLTLRWLGLTIHSFLVESTIIQPIRSIARRRSLALETGTTSTHTSRGARGDGNRSFIRSPGALLAHFSRSDTSRHRSTRRKVESFRSSARNSEFHSIFSRAARKRKKRLTLTSRSSLLLL